MPGRSVVVEDKGKAEGETVRKVIEVPGSDGHHL